MHDWCPVSLLCTRCGVHVAEAEFYGVPCFPTPRGAVFTIKMQRFLTAFYGPFLSEDDQIRRLDT